MKRILYLLLFVFCLLGLTGCEADPLDEIEDYQIIINPLADGTLQMDYTIKWKVLDSSSEGPLTWVKIGIATKYISNLESHSSDYRVSYYDDDGSFIRVDLNQSYYKGDTVIFGFSFIQKRIFTHKDSFVNYSFIPGWFEEIKVDKIMVKWHKDDIYSSNCDRSDNEYLIWEKALDFDESIKVNVSYHDDYFPNINFNEGYKEDHSDMILGIVVIVSVVIGIVLLIVFCSVNNDGYTIYRGFAGPNWYNYLFFGRAYYGTNRNGKTYSAPKIVNGSGGGSHCACACACAGGGRAGCSRKDFYGKYPKIKF